MRFAVAVVVALSAGVALAQPKQPTPEVEAFWRACAAKIADPPEDDFYRVRHFGDDADMAARLLALIKAGEKSITFTTPRLYQGDRNKTPIVDDLTVVTDFAGTPGAVVRTSWVKTVPFNEITERESQYEGAPVRPLEAWRKVHWDFFTRALAPFGEAPSETMPVTVEKFELVCTG
jgi:uncharacterized protein YhfF